MRDLWRHLVPDHRNVSPEELKQTEGSNRHERRANRKKTAKFLKEASNHVTTEMQNGAGLLSDAVLREYLLEFNNRNWGHGFSGLPSSFNVLEAFLAFHAREGWFGLREERDHIFLFPDFLDFATSTDAPSDSTASVELLPEGVIHSYNAIGNLKDIAFLHADGASFVVAGITFIRFGKELSWLLIGGVVTDLKAESERVKARFAAMIADPKKYKRKDLDLSDAPKPEAVSLPGTEDVWKTHLFGRFDLNTKQHQVRFLARDEGAFYTTITDDPSDYSNAELNDGQIVERLEHTQAVLNDNSLLTELAVTCFALPAYFRFKVQLVREVQRETRFARIGSAIRPKQRAAIVSGAEGQRIRYRRVTALEIINLNHQPVVRTYTPPRFQVEVNGFWRRLSAPDIPGRGPNGEAVVGRTWVSRTHALAG